MHSPCPSGLAGHQLRTLQQYRDQHGRDDLAVWSERVADHLTLIEQTAETNRLLNRSLGQRIGRSLQRAIDEAAGLDAEQRSWLIAAACYFVESDDEEHDFASPIGFEDDAEVAQAVLRMIGRDDQLHDA